MIMGITMNLTGIWLAISFGRDYAKTGFGENSWMILVCSMVLVLTGSYEIYNQALGHLGKDSDQTPLETNEIYEVISSVEVNGKYAVILQTRSGVLLAYTLDEDPPKTFKVVEVKSSDDDIHTEYELYPKPQ